MHKRQIKEKIFWMGGVDWERRLFDSLIPLPDGTTYNTYLVPGSEKTALLDTVDPPMAEELMAQLDECPKSTSSFLTMPSRTIPGPSFPVCLTGFQAKVVCPAKAKAMLIDLLRIPETALSPMTDGETLSFGDKTLQFIHTPWVHWPETMVTYLEEDRILFSCDFYGSHIADHRSFCDRSGAGVRSRQTLLCRDHDAFSECDRKEYRKTQRI